jgi:outer membrane protein assembly factor BamB
MIPSPEGVPLKVLSRPRHWLFGAALLLVTLSACGAPLPGESWAGISTDGKYVYVAYKEQVFRIDPQRGAPSAQRQIDWLAQSPSKAHMYAPPALADDGVLFEGAYDHKVYAFLTDGRLLNTWNSPTATDRIIGGALVHDDLVYVGMGDKGLKALDRKTGAERWTYPDTAYGVWSTPLVVGDTLYFASLDHRIYALEAKTGAFKWKVDLGGAIAGQPLFDANSGILYVGTFANQLVAVSLADQTVVRHIDTDGWVWGTPVLYKGTLYFGDLKGWVYAVDPNTFEVKWKASDSDHPGAIRGSLAVAKSKDQDIVIAGSESKYLRAYNAQSGQVVWTSAISTDDQILSDLIVIGNDVIFTTLNEKQLVAAFSTETGQKNWQVDLTVEVPRLQTATSAPVISTPVPSATGAAATAASTAASNQ